MSDSVDQKKLFVQQQLAQELQDKNPLVESQLELLDAYLSNLSENGIGDKSPIEARRFHRNMLMSLRFSLLNSFNPPNTVEEYNVKRAMLKLACETKSLQRSDAQFIGQMIHNIIDNVDLSDKHKDRLERALDTATKLRTALYDETQMIAKKIMTIPDEETIIALEQYCGEENTTQIVETELANQQDQKEWELEVEGEPTRFLSSREMLMKALPILNKFLNCKDISTKDTVLLVGMGKLYKSIAANSK